jgi:hypothetical protein
MDSPGQRKRGRLGPQRTVTAWTICHDGRMRDFDPVKLGGHEADAWVAYYQRRWAAFLRAAFDVDHAAELEIGWWAVHRAVQHGGVAPLVDALTALYAHVYGVPAAAVRPAAELRADAMVISDAWVAAGCDPGSDAIAAERQELIKGYALLRAAV